MWLWEIAAFLISYLKKIKTLNPKAIIAVAATTTEQIRHNNNLNNRQ